MNFPERKPFTPDPTEKPREEGPSPRRPDVDRGGTDNLMKRMRKVDPKQAERYRQRTGE
jgi:hypothetical protein